MSGTDFSTKRISLGFLLFAAVLGLLVATMQPTQAQTLTMLYSFTGGCYGGVMPTGGLAIDPQGNLYGVWSGPRGCKKVGGHGAVFKVTPLGTETTLYYFTKKTGSGPVAGPILDLSGNLYGTTRYGGLHTVTGGTVFEVTPSGTETVLHSFGKYRGSKKKPADGYNPAASLIFDSQGNLYGTTTFGGNYRCAPGQGCGAVFKLTPSGTETLLYKFNGGADGAFPYAPVAFDQNGNLYGTTLLGGGSGCGGGGCGVVFKLAPDGTETVLYSFTGGADGWNPNGGLLSDSQGNLYGLTLYGGTVNSNCPQGCGIVFMLTSSGTESVLYTFTGGSDGAYPSGSLIFDSQGNLYGVAGGGIYDGGVIFEITPSDTLTILYSFTGWDDGAEPNGPLVFDSQGNLYGTTWGAGTYGYGTVFKLTP